MRRRFLTGSRIVDATLPAGLSTRLSALRGAPGHRHTPATGGRMHGCVEGILARGGRWAFAGAVAGDDIAGGPTHC